MSQFKIRQTDIDPMEEHMKDRELRFDAPKVLDGNGDIKSLFKDDEKSEGSDFMKMSQSVYDSHLRESTSSLGKSLAESSLITMSVKEAPGSSVPILEFPIFALDRDYMQALVAILQARLSPHFVFAMPKQIEEEAPQPQVAVPKM